MKTPLNDFYQDDYNPYDQMKGQVVNHSGELYKCQFCSSLVLRYSFQKPYTPTCMNRSCKGSLIKIASLYFKKPFGSNIMKCELISTKNSRVFLYKLYSARSFSYDYIVKDLLLLLYSSKL